MARLVRGTRFHWGFFLAVALAFVVFIFLWRTTIGYRMRAAGEGPNAARAAGIDVEKYQILAMALAGGFAGLAGMVEVLGVHRRVLEGLSAGYGFSGIVVALFGRLHPIGAIPAAILFGMLTLGADMMQRAVAIPAAIVMAIQGLVVLFVVGSDILVRHPEIWQRWFRKKSPVRKGGWRRTVQGVVISNVVIGILATGVRLLAPFLFASIGEMFCQRSGVFNLGVEGIMMMGAFVGFFVTLRLGNPYLGVVMAILIGIALGLLMALVSVTMQAPQGISGIGLHVLLGLVRASFPHLCRLHNEHRRV